MTDASYPQPTSWAINPHTSFAKTTHTKTVSTMAMVFHNNFLYEALGDSWVENVAMNIG